jgi:hypothetical protein
MGRFSHITASSPVSSSDEPYNRIRDERDAAKAAAYELHACLKIASIAIGTGRQLTTHEMTRIVVALSLYVAAEDAR